MKLKNKKTGEIVELRSKQQLYEDEPHLFLDTKNGRQYYDSLTELNKEWGYYEEPKKHYEILAMGAVMEREDAEDEIFRNQGQREIGNYFRTKEEAERAVEKLKAWKRLKKRHFKFDDYDILNQTATWLVSREYDQYENDIKLLFGGEE